MNIVNAGAVTTRGAPALRSRVPASWRRDVPDYCALLEEANGLSFHRGGFRVFGVGEECPVRDALTWNRSSWRSAYRVSDTVLFWGENIFGDQFGVDTRSGELVSLTCEGGESERLPFKTPTLFLESLVDGDPKEAPDAALLAAADAMGLWPDLSQHLSFVVPLVCGGTPSSDNLEVMDAAAHLELLGQIIQQTKGLPAGTKIGGFKAMR